MPSRVRSWCSRRGAGRDALGVVPKLPMIYDEPFADASQIPTYLVAKFARQQVTVALSGDGGDEMMGGYVRHQAIPAIWRRVGWWPRSLRHMAGKAIHRVPVERWDRLARRYPQFGERLYKVADILELKSMEDAYIHVMSRWNNPSARTPAQLSYTMIACAPANIWAFRYSCTARVLTSMMR